MMDPTSWEGRSVGTTTAHGRLDADLEDFCTEAFPRLVRALAPLCGDLGVAEEIAQEALVRVVERWDHVRGMAYPMSWVHRVAFNLATSRFRRRAAERRAYRRHGAPDVLAGSGDLPDVAGAVAVRAALATLPERQRRAVALRYFADLPVAEVAQEMGITPGSVKVMTSRGLASLRAALDVELVRAPAAAAVPPLEPEELAGRAERRRATRRTAAVAAGVAAIVLALAWARVWLPFERLPVVDQPESLEELSWGEPVEHAFAPVLNDFLPTAPVVEAGGRLWSPGHDTVLTSRSLSDGTVVEEVDVPGVRGRSVCHLESSADDRLVALLCPVPSAGETTQVTGILVLEPARPEVARVVDRPAWMAAIDAVEVVDGAIWTFGSRSLVRIDADTGAETEVALPDGIRPRSLTGGFGSLWLTTPSTPDTPADATGELVRVDPVDGTVIARIVLGHRDGTSSLAARATPHDVAVGDTRLWVELAGEARLAAVDPATERVVTHADLGELVVGGGRVTPASGRTRPVAGAGRVWAQVGGRVLVIHPGTGAVQAIGPPVPVQDPGDVSGVAVTSGGDVWFGDWRRRIVFQLPVVTP